MKTNNWLKFGSLALIIFTAILYFRLGRDYLFDWDEAIYAELGRSLVKGASWLTPTWNKEIWLEKPPLVAWVTALGFKLTGFNELGARLLMPIISALSLIFIYYIGKKLVSPRTGVIAASLLGYFNLFLIRARTVNTDGMLMAAITGTVALLLAGAQPWIVSLVAALAVMGKGLAGLLSVVIALPLLINKDKKYLLHFTFYFLLFTVPWHLYQLVVNGNEFINPYLLEQVLRRATVPIEFHLESRWFYFVFLYQDLGLGMLIGVLTGLFFAIRQIFTTKINNLHSIIQAVWWIFVPLSIFTLAKTRLSWYILPIYPALALIIAYGLERLAASPRAQKVMNILAVGFVLQTLWHAYQYVEPHRSKATTLPPQLVVAQKLADYPVNSVAMLVSQSERTAEAILPQDQRISSSFRYGGAPSVVWYLDKQVEYYYNTDLFRDDMEAGKHQAAIVTEEDSGKIRDLKDLAIHAGAYSAYIDKELIEK